MTGGDHSGSLIFLKNPATLLPLIEANNEHDCLANIEKTTSARPDFLQTTRPNSDLILYIDGSACGPSVNKHLAGYAVAVCMM